MTTGEVEFAKLQDDPLRKATPSVDDVEARRARAAIEGRLFSGPARRVKVGRYRVLGRIGSGGMGVVYKAHDPELARDVAVKLMNPDAVTESDADMARGRLVREARAMARLAHPNVIHVYDVGTVEDGVFIAMELVEGQSLGAWMKAQPRPWREALARFIEAGRGLAAAHDAGVIHRDFKPENVLLGADGRVRVGDFGLAGGPGSETGRHEPTPADSVRAQIDRSAISDALTRTGALLGTPKYMAPEQEAGLSATARSDQFSFCVALYEALYGQAPYAGDSVVEYRLEVRDGAVRAPPASEVPAAVAEALLRGLANEPADRYPSMDALLDRLADALADPVAAPLPPRKRPVLWLSAAAVLIGFAGLLAFVVDRPVQEREAVPIEVASTSPGPIQSAFPDATPPSPPAPASDAPRPEPAPAAPEPTPPEAGTQPKRTTPKGPGARSRGWQRNTCYFDEKLTFVRTAKPRLEHLADGKGRCYVQCHPYRGNPDNLTPSCRQNYICTEDPDKDACAS